jgi:hypothetical protein
MNNTSVKKAVLYRMVMGIMFYGLKPRDLLRCQGYEVEDNWLTTREQVDAFKDKHKEKPHIKPLSTMSELMGIWFVFQKLLAIRCYGR